MFMCVCVFFSEVIFNKCMVGKDYERPSFKEILDVLDPDLSPDFKQTSYYHNEFRKKQFNKSSGHHSRGGGGGKKLQESSSPLNENVEDILNSIKIVEPFIGNSDNYM